MSAQAATPDTQQRHFQFRYELTVRDVPAATKRIAVWLPVPIDNAAQRVLDVTVSAPVDGTYLTESTYGNRVWYADFDRPEGTDFSITQSVEVVRHELVASRLSVGDKESSATPAPARRFLSANRLVPLSKRFASIARRVTRDQVAPLDRSRSLYTHVLGHMAYDKSGTKWGQGDAIYACDFGKGNCTDFHSYFIALSRSADIPARFHIGFSIPQGRGTGTVGGYHCWAEFWTAGAGWIPVDISEADKHPEKADYFFGAIDENRIAYSLGRDLVLPKRTNAPPLNYFVYPYVEVDGKPWDDVDRRFTYEDISDHTGTARKP